MSVTATHVAASLASCTQRHLHNATQQSSLHSTARLVQPALDCVRLYLTERLEHDNGHEVVTCVA